MSRYENRSFPTLFICGLFSKAALQNFQTRMAQWYSNGVPSGTTLAEYTEYCVTKMPENKVVLSQIKENLKLLKATSSTQDYLLTLRSLEKARQSNKKIKQKIGDLLANEIANALRPRSSRVPGLTPS